MHAWIKDGTVVTILPAEHEPDEMGPVYQVSYHDSETLFDLAHMRANIVRMEKDFHKRLAAKLRKEQGLTTT